MCACLVLLSACHNKEKDEELAAAQSMAEASKESLIEAIADRDSLLSLVNEINEGMDQIKELEKILTVQGDLGETQTQREKINADIAAIRQTLQERREKIASLEKKLNSSQFENSELKKTIETLKEQLESQSSQIQILTAQLDQAQIAIGKLEQDKDSLNKTITTVTSEKEAAQQEAIETANEMNKCYYAIGSKSELKQQKIIESGFLKKTKLMKGDFEQTYFTVADRRTLDSIPLHSQKAKVLTNHPSGSYEIVDADGQKCLNITNSASFWSLSNYLVVQTD